MALYTDILLEQLSREPRTARSVLVRHDLFNTHGAMLPVGYRKSLSIASMRKDVCTVWVFWYPSAQTVL